MITKKGKKRILTILIPFFLVTKINCFQREFLIDQSLLLNFAYVLFGALTVLEITHIFIVINIYLSLYDMKDIHLTLEKTYLIFDIIRDHILSTQFVYLFDYVYHQALVLLH